MSGTSVRNEKVKEANRFHQVGDEVIVARLDRLGRSLKFILEGIESTHKRGDCSKIINGSLNTKNDNPFATSMINLCEVFAQLERDLIKARTTEGREEAKAKGKHMGSLPALSDK